MDRGGGGAGATAAVGAAEVVRFVMESAVEIWYNMYQFCERILMMQITKREFLKKLGLGAIGLASGSAFADEYVETSKGLPAGSVGDPDNAWFGKHIFDLKHTMVDGPSAYMANGKVKIGRAHV